MAEDPLDDLERDARLRILDGVVNPEGEVLVNLQQVIDALRSRAAECHMNAATATAVDNQMAACGWTMAGGELEGRADAFAVALLGFKAIG